MNYHVRPINKHEKVTKEKYGPLKQPGVPPKGSLIQEIQSKGHKSIEWFPGPSTHQQGIHHPNVVVVGQRLDTLGKQRVDVVLESHQLV